MKTSNVLARWGRRARGSMLALAFAGTVLPVHSATKLADAPLFSTTEVPGNLILATSVEYPTAISVANLGNYSTSAKYMGYFDSAKCYTYQYNSTTPGNSYFKPDGAASATYTCAGKWSGHFLNWATMQTIDPYRWAMTGGYRAVDTTSMTILEKAWGAEQGSLTNFPLRGTDQGTGHKLSSAVNTVTPLSWSKFNLRIWGRGNRMVFVGDGSTKVNNTTATDWQNASDTKSTTTAYQVYVRVQVCADKPPTESDPSGTGESNCKAYGSNYKPEGLMQKYSQKIRYSAFGYLNDSNILRDGGVMRAKMKFIGPEEPVPGSIPKTNSAAEWSASTGIFVTNPNTSDATDSGVSNSGVMNYLNKFGLTSKTYKTYDNVSEMYYAAVRYMKKQGNVPEWTNSTNATMVDGFPVIKSWDDPIAYSCQKNFILGIGDVNSHADANLPGSTPALRTNNPAMPAAVSSDSTVNVTNATNNLGQREGRGNLGTVFTGTGTSTTWYMAGLAYDSHTMDMRPDLDGKQTMSTFWLDVMEYQEYKTKNIYWLAAKYGGFSVPEGFSPYADTKALDEATWYTTKDTLTTPGGVVDKRPDNYFQASKADLMVEGLNKAFTQIVSAMKAQTTSFSAAGPAMTEGSASYAASFDAGTWSGDVEASSVSIDTSKDSYVVTKKLAWKFADKLGLQAAGTGWNTDRRIVTWNGSAGIPFRGDRLTGEQQTALKTDYTTSDTAADYVNYLRGDRTKEGTWYRRRGSLVGDIVGSRAQPVGAPSFPFAETMNPGYAAFKSTHAGRPTVVYVGSNGGMLHAIHGDTSGTNAGRELFAYVPSFLFKGPSNPATPAENGLAVLGHPDYGHRYFVNATPVIQDIDSNNTHNRKGSPEWITLLVGGLGKGGKGYYALDVTDPVKMANGESDAAAKVLWEFTDPDMGYSFGEPVVVKTTKYGWVVVLTSGYDNADHQGWFFILDAFSGKLIDKVSTKEGSATAPAGLAHANGYLPDRLAGFADTVYAGDLNGGVWRLDLTDPAGKFPVTKLAQLNYGGKAQPITTKATIGVQINDQRRRMVVVGTGQMLDTPDIKTSDTQSFYVIADGSQWAFAKTAPAGMEFPFTRNNLVPNPTLKKPMVVDFAKYAGWYHDLEVKDGLAYRIVSDPMAMLGSANIIATLPNGSTCSPQGVGRVYSIDLTDAYSNFGPADNAIPYYDTGAVPTEVSTMTYGGQQKTRIHLPDGQDIDIDARTRESKRKWKRANWRELPMAD